MSDEPVPCCAADWLPPRGLAACEMSWLAGTNDAATLLGLAFSELVARRVLDIHDTGRVLPGTERLARDSAEVLRRVHHAAVGAAADRANVAWIADRIMRDEGHPRVWARTAIGQPLAEIGCAVTAERHRWGIAWGRTSYVPTELGLHQIHRLGRSLDPLDFEDLDRLAVTNPKVALAQIDDLGVGLLLIPELYPVAHSVAERLAQAGSVVPTVAGLHLAELRNVPIRTDVGRYDALNDD